MADLRLTQQLSIDHFNNGGLYQIFLTIMIVIGYVILNTKWFIIQISHSNVNQVLSFLADQNRHNAKLYQLFYVLTNQRLNKKAWCINKDKEGYLTAP